MQKGQTPGRRTAGRRIAGRQNAGRRTLLLGIAAGTLGLTLGGGAWAQDNYPNRPIRVVVPFPPGGPTDTATRIVANAMSEKLGQTIVVENKAGASGMIGAQSVANEAPDGYTVLVMANPTLMAPHLYGAQGVDPVKDFTPIAGIYELPIVLVINPKSLPEVKTLDDLVAHAKATPNLNYTSAGNGSFGHLSMELMKSLGGFEMQHIPYKGSAPAIADVLGGQVPVMFSDMIAALPHIQAGTLLPVGTGMPERLASMPDLKTISEQGYSGFAAFSWGGWVGPKGMPDSVVKKLESNLKEVLDDPKVQERLVAVGTIPVFTSAEEQGAWLQSEYDKWGKVIKDNNISSN